MKKGFTLIETVIYIALFGLLLSTGFVTVYQLINGANINSNKGIVQDEGNFVSKKLDWILSNLDLNNLPTSSAGCDQTLTVYKNNFSSNPIEVRHNGTLDILEMREGGSGTFIPLTTINSSTTCFEFQITSPSPYVIVATTTINKLKFVTTKYLRQ
jgi:type II secretory pathway pseudopilin PulG